MLNELKQSSSGNATIGLIHVFFGLIVLVGLKPILANV
jgi:hypothetical protein